MDSWKILLGWIFVGVTFQNGVAADCDWGYFGSKDASNWSSICAGSECAGESQSPIDIKTADTKKTSVPELRVTAPTSLDNTQLDNNGYVVTLFFNSKEVRVSGGGLFGDYTAEQLHFHWGKNNSFGSEHLVNGQSFPLEMHIVTYQSSFTNITEALGYRSKPLAVLGFFFEIDETPNDDLQIIVSNLRNVNESGSNYTMEEGVRMKSIIPGDLTKFYHYHGSLTTPTCKEVVSWYVFNKTLKISSSQMSEFRKLQASEINDEGNYDMYNNFRPVQDLNNRVVFDVTAHIKKEPMDKPIPCSSTIFQPSTHLFLVLSVLNSLF